MPVLVVGGICRFTLHGTNGRPWANILDFHIDSDVGASRDEAIEDQAEIINQEWPSAWDDFWASTVSYTGISWVDLDTAEGSTGSTTETSGALVLPKAGVASGEADPPNVSYLVHKRVGSGRGRRSGRIYVPGAPEGMTNLQNISASPLTSMNTMVNTLLGALNQESAPLSIGSYNSFLSVVHQPLGGEPSFDHVDDLEVDQLLATQRRRLRG
jgi:hypothetical protein